MGMYPPMQYCWIPRHTRSMIVCISLTEKFRELCPIARNSTINKPANELYQDKMEEKSWMIAASQQHKIIWRSKSIFWLWSYINFTAFTRIIHDKNQKMLQFPGMIQHYFFSNHLWTWTLSNVILKAPNGRKYKNTLNQEILASRQFGTFAWAN